jgi:mannose-6-phosphate isomerase-like protein (cupin superfamily)
MKRRDFIATTMLGSFAGSSFLSDSFAQLTENKPRAITNKIKKRPLPPFYIKPDHSPAYTGGTKIRFDQTNNQFSSFELIIPPKTLGPPPHVHKDLDEVMRVLKGKVTVMVGEKLFEVEEGGWHLRPHGIVHTFWNAGDEPAVFIDIYPNQNFEIFLEELIKLFGEFAKENMSPDSKEGRRRQDELQAEWGISMYYEQRQSLMEKYGLK